MTQPGRIRVLVVDDSAIVRRILTEALSAEADMEVVGSAPDPYVARDKIVSLHPDVLTLDIEMPRMDGLTFLKKLMHFHPLPVVVISSLGQSSCAAAVEALRLGAVEVLAKPGGPYSVGDLRHQLASRVRAAACSRRRPVPADPAPERPPAQKVRVPALAGDGRIVAIGASTGGTEAIHYLLTRLPAAIPGMVITQHIPPVFSRAFAQRLDKTCAFEVREAADGDVVRPGLALVAPGDFHMIVRRQGTGYVVQVKGGPQVCYQRPSVDVLFSSVAEACGRNATGVILTGMGADGAQGMLRMRNAGAHTVAQNEETCVVFGMPKEAIRLGAAAEVMSLGQIAKLLSGANVPAGVK